MSHVRPDQMSSCQGAAEAQFSCKNAGSHDSGQASRVVARIDWVCSSDAEQVEHCTLRLKDCTTANGADLDGRHGDADL